MMLNILNAYLPPIYSYILSGEESVQIFRLFFKLGCCVLTKVWELFFNIFWTQVLYHIYTLQKFLPVCGLSFHSSNNITQRIKVINFHKVYHCVCVCVFWVIYLRNHFLIQSHKNALLCFLLEVLQFWGFTFRSMIHFQLIFLYEVRYEYSSLFCIWICNCSSTICWKDYLFSTKCVKNQLFIYVWVYFLALYSIPLICLSLSLWQVIKSDRVNPLTFFLLKVLATVDLSYFHTIFKNSLSGQPSGSGG